MRKPIYYIREFLLSKMEDKKKMTLINELQIPEKLKPVLERIAVKFAEGQDFKKWHLNYARNFMKTQGLSNLEALNEAFGEFPLTFGIVITSKPITDPDFDKEIPVILVDVKNAEACVNCQNYKPRYNISFPSSVEGYRTSGISCGECDLHDFRYAIREYFVCDDFDAINPSEGKEINIALKFVWKNGEWELKKSFQVIP